MAFARCEPSSVDASRPPINTELVDYETFRTLWIDGLQASRLQIIGAQGTETLNTRNLDRSYQIHFEPVGGQDAPPFHVKGTLSWRWTALNTSRGIFRDGDALSEMLGRDQTEDLVTNRPYIRIDIELSASAPYGKPLPMPSKTAWAKWVEETVERLDHIEPLLPNEVIRKNRMGMTEVLAWQGDPQVQALCAPGGELMLEKVAIAAFQIMELPRLLDSPDREDEGPESQIQELFGRVRASLMAWMQALDHLRPR